MLLENLIIKEATVKNTDAVKKTIRMGADVIISRFGKRWTIPVLMQFDFKDNGSYPTNYKQSVETFMKECEQLSEKWKVDPERDKIWI